MKKSIMLSEGEHHELLYSKMDGSKMHGIVEIHDFLPSIMLGRGDNIKKYKSVKCLMARLEQKTVCVAIVVFRKCNISQLKYFCYHDRSARTDAWTK